MRVYDAKLWAAEVVLRPSRKRARGSVSRNLCRGGFEGCSRIKIVIATVGAAGPEAISCLQRSIACKVSHQ